MLTSVAVNSLEHCQFPLFLGLPIKPLYVICSYTWQAQLVHVLQSGGDACSHPEDTERCVGHGCIEGGSNTKRQDSTRITWIDNTIIPQACCTVVRIALLFVFIQNGLHK